MEWLKIHCQLQWKKIYRHISGYDCAFICLKIKKNTGDEIQHKFETGSDWKMILHNTRKIYCITYWVLYFMSMPDSNQTLKQYFISLKLW